MGFFDRFKKIIETKEEQNVIPLELQYSDGTVAEVTFRGLCEVDGKFLQSVKAIYYGTDGSFEARSFLIEPITSIDERSQEIDATESYYRWMAQSDGSREAKERYNAIKGFFKKGDTTVEKMGSDYIGSLAQRDDGSYYRYFDNDFKKQREAYYRETKNRLVDDLKSYINLDNYPKTTDPEPYFQSEKVEIFKPKKDNVPPPTI